jgi:hypothetical protein
MIMTTLAALAAHFFVPESPERTPGRINVSSALLMSTWLVTLLLAVSQGHSWGWGSPVTLGRVLAHDHVWQLLVETTLLGLALGLAFAALSNLIVDAVPQSQTGVASGMNANIRTVGGALGSAVIASVFTVNARADGLPLESGYTNGFTVLVVTSGLAALVAVLVPVVKAGTRVLPTMPLPSSPLLPSMVEPHSPSAAQLAPERTDDRALSAALG